MGCIELKNEKELNCGPYLSLPLSPFIVRG